MNHPSDICLREIGLFDAPTSYEGARAHAQALDLHLGVEVARIEGGLLVRARGMNPEGSHASWGASIHQGNQTWVGLSHQTLQTPYSELKSMCEDLKLQTGLMVDLGAGYGRMGLVLHGLYPEMSFLGYECVAERVREGNRIFEKYHCHRAILVEKDLMDPTFELPEADYYLIYDYGTVAHIRHTLKQLEKMADRKNFKLIARGKGTRSLIAYEHPWLSAEYSVDERFAVMSF
jgi:hypothetical protein